MAVIQNSDLIQELVRVSKTQSAFDLPRTLSPIINPTLETHPFLVVPINVVKNNQSAATGTVTVYTAPTAAQKAKAWLWGFTVSYVKDATCDIATGRLALQITQLGVTRDLMAFPVITLTAQSERASIMLPKPILLDPGTSIVYPVTYSLGVMSRTCTAFVYEESST